MRQWHKNCTNDNKGRKRFENVGSLCWISNAPYKNKQREKYNASNKKSIDIISSCIAEDNIGHRATAVSIGIVAGIRIQKKASNQ